LYLLNNADQTCKLSFEKEFVFMVMPAYEWTFRRVVWATLVLIFIALSFWLVFHFYKIFFILLIAVIIGTVIRPIVSWLYQRGLPRIGGVILVYCLMLAALIGFALLVFPLIAEQGGKIIAAMPGYYQSLREWVSGYPNPLISRLKDSLPATLPGLGANQPLRFDVTASAGHALDYVSQASWGIFVTIVVLVLAFYWTLDGPRAIQSMLLLVPQEQRENIRELIAAIERKVSLYVVGQAILCAVIGIMALIAYLIIGLPNALVLAFMAAVLEAVPMLGPLLGAIPAAIIALSIDPSKLVWVIIATIVIQEAENSFLVPRVMDKTVGVNPFVSLLAFFAFSSLFGIAGALLAIPLAAIIQLLLDRFVFRAGEAEVDLSTGRDYASRLRYEAQNLAQDIRKQARVETDAPSDGARQADPIMDEIEAIATDLDSLLAQLNTSGAS
jgi:predicted PurR-regulated permease PerM